MTKNSSKIQQTMRQKLTRLFLKMTWLNTLCLILLSLSLPLSAQSTPDYDKAEQLKNQGAFNQANRIYFIALRDNDTDLQALEGLSDSYFRMQRWKKAKKQLTRLIKATPDNEVKELALVRRAMVFGYQKKWKKAIKDYQQVSEMNPERSDVWLSMSEAYEQLGKQKKAKKAKAEYEQRVQPQTEAQ
ncbi:MAG: tetratricopeptide repeat protein [Gammaproteobacteria bacterium]|nr:tetratricopeptide repeat protein [Gammaproteobacteria bacterium]